MKNISSYLIKEIGHDRACFTICGNPLSTFEDIVVEDSKGTTYLVRGQHTIGKHGTVDVTGVRVADVNLFKWVVLLVLFMMISILTIGCVTARKLPPCSEYEEAAAIVRADAEYGSRPKVTMDWFREAEAAARDFMGCQISSDIEPDMDRMFITTWDSPAYDQGFEHGWNDGKGAAETEMAQYAYSLIDLYGDICAESSTGYEYMVGYDAHFYGVVCAAGAMINLAGGELYVEGDVPTATYDTELAKYKEAYEMRTDQYNFWFDNFEECADNNYEEARQEDNHQVELIFRRGEDEECGACEGDIL